MLGSNGHVKLVDFGLACKIEDDAFEITTSPLGSLIYMAPELLAENVAGRHTDWWAVGILAYEIMAGRSPWTNVSDKQLTRQEIIETRVFPPLSLSPTAGMFICSLLKHDRSKRLGATDELELRLAPFFSSIDWEATESHQAPPAFVPGSECIVTEESEEALHIYIMEEARDSSSSPRDLRCEVTGLKNVETRPALKPAQTSCGL